MGNYLGIDVGGSKTAALIASESGQALGISIAGPGNYELVGWQGFKDAVNDAVQQVLCKTNLGIDDISGIGSGISGYDWPSQKVDHLNALSEIGLESNIDIVNDAVLGILAGAEGGWGVSVVSGNGCNCRGLSKDHKTEGRVVGGESQWSGEFAGGYDILARAMRAVVFQWNKRGPQTKLTPLFIDLVGANNLDDLIEGLYVGRYQISDSTIVMQVFELANDGDPEAINVMKWAGQELGELVCGVIRQLDIQKEQFDIVLIGSIFKGHPLISGELGTAVWKIANKSRLVKLAAPPVVGAVILGMEQAGLDGVKYQKELIRSTEKLTEGHQK